MKLKINVITIKDGEVNPVEERTSYFNNNVKIVDDTIEVTAVLENGQLNFM